MATTSRARSVIQPASAIVYPESDGKPLGETGVHVDVTLTLLGVMCRYFGDNPMVALLSNMFVYYVEGDPRRNVCPDLFVTLDVPSKTTRPTFKVWEEGKAPDLVIEVTSKKTRKEDLGRKFELYRDVLKVREYFLFDPFEEYLEPSLQGHRLSGARYVPIAMVAGRLPSEVLGLHLERDELDLRLYNPRTKLWLMTGLELGEALKASQAARRRERAARRKQEAARQAEEAARRQAEAEVVQLRREVEMLRRRAPGQA